MSFVTLSILAEFWKGARAIARRNQMNLARATVELTFRNTRRYGGYLVHMGIVLMFVAWTGAAFNLSEVQEVKVGDHMEVGSYRLQVADIQQGENDNYVWHRALMRVSRNGSDLDTLQPERRFYKASQQGTSQVAVRQHLNEDLYLNFAGMTEDNQRAIVQSYVFPLVTWMWLGGLMLIGGTLIALVPSKVKMQYPRTEVVGMASKHAQVEK
jgi:cytochrome c-type biogenesis protein CcmF